MSSIHKLKVNVLQHLEGSFSTSIKDLPHVTHNPSLTLHNFDTSDDKENYFITRLSHRHDGTLMFTSQIMQELLLPLLNKTVCSPDIKEKMEKGDVLTDIHYEVGDLWCYGITADYSKSGWKREEGSAIPKHHTREEVRMVVKRGGISPIILVTPSY